MVVNAISRFGTKAEMEGARVDQAPFEKVVVPAQMGPSHAAGVIDMRT